MPTDSNNNISDSCGGGISVHSDYVGIDVVGRCMLHLQVFW